MNTFSKICILLTLLFSHGKTLAQINNTDNLGFEKGTFEGWQLSYGDVRLVNNQTTYLNETDGTISNRHEIVSIAQGNDPKIKQEAIPVVNAGSRYSMRIGKTERGSTFERATTSFVVTSAHSLFQYHFAVLLQEDQDNRHSKAQKPGFSLKITDASGSNVLCGDFDVQLEGKLLAGFKSQGDIDYRNWTTGSIDLRQHIGKTLKVEVTAHGCTQQGHFGYAYFDAELLKSELLIPSVCPDQNGLLTIIAPEGFENYVWSNGMVGQKISTPAVLGQQFTATITPFSSLDAACNFKLNIKIPFKKIETNLTKSLCEGEVFNLVDTNYGTTGKYSKTISRAGICDSTINLDLFVGDVPDYYEKFQKCLGEIIQIGTKKIESSGYYEVRIPRAGKCDSMVHATVEFEDLKIKVSEDQKIVIGDSLQLQSQIISGIEGASKWTSLNSTLCNNCSDLIIKPINDNTYTYKLTSSSGICSRSASLNVIVLPCVINFPDVFTPNYDLENPVFFGFASSCISKMESFTIFNRWGEEVFKRNDLPVSNGNFGWDGKIKGQDASPGVYQYQVKAVLKNGKTENYAGKVMILK